MTTPRHRSHATGPKTAPLPLAPRRALADERTLTRRIVATRNQLELLPLLGSVPAGDASLSIEGPREPTSLDATAAYEASLRAPGRFARPCRLVLEAVHHGGHEASLVVRTTCTRTASWCARHARPDHHDRTVAAALATIERLLPWQEAVRAPLPPEVAGEVLAQGAPLRALHGVRVADRLGAAEAEPAEPDATVPAVA